MANFPGKLMNKAAFIAVGDKYWALSFCGLINNKKYSIELWRFMSPEEAARKVMASNKARKMEI